MVSDGLFPGFPSRSEATPIPAIFFTEVLPQLDDLLELLHHAPLAARVAWSANRY